MNENICENKTENSRRMNPLFELYNTPHDTAPFGHISISDFEGKLLWKESVVTRKKQIK